MSQFKKRFVMLFAAMFFCAAYLLPSASLTAYEVFQSNSNLSEPELFRLLMKEASQLQSSCCFSQLRNAPPFVKSKKGFPELQVAVLNRSSGVSNHLLKRALEAVNTQVKCDFAPYYGIHVKFNVFEDERQIDWQKYSPLVITDFLLFPPDGAFAFVTIQDPSSLNGAPISDFIANPPPLPNGTPYGIILIGSVETETGIAWTATLGRHDIPPTFDTIFSYATSFCTLSVLGNLSINKYAQKFNDVGGLFNLEMYQTFPVSPVGNNPGYLVNCTNVENFALPSFWDSTGLATGPFDFLETTSAPLTPFQGRIFFFRMTDSGTDQFRLISPFNDPTNLQTVFLGHLFSCPLADKEVKKDLPKLSNSKILSIPSDN